jgi:hypothetical protein
MSPSYDAAEAWVLEEVITEDDPTTVEEEWEAQRIASLPENLQRYAVEHKQNELDATPAYFDRFK